MLIIIFLVFVFSNQLALCQLDSILNIEFNYTEILEKLEEVLDKVPRTICTQHLLFLSNGLSEGEMWAVKMVDATAKPQSGILHGNIMHIGNYDECLEINERVERSQIQGQYCSTFLRPHPQFGKDFDRLLSSFMEDFSRNDDENQLTDDGRLTYGFCMPKVCSAEDLQELFDLLETSIESPFHFIFDQRFCDGGDGQKFTSGAIVAIIVFAIFAFLLIFGTFYEYFVWMKLKDSEKQTNFLMAFSVITNGKKLFSTASPGDSLFCLNGLRVISMMWIVLAHGFQNSFYVPHVNAKELLEWQDRTGNAFVTGSAMSVDTFFVISGLLVVFLYMKSQATGGKLNIPMFYIHRLLRLTPSLAMVVLFTTTLLIHTGDGPFWPIVEDMFQKPCETNWWSTLIYLQTYLNPNNQCIGQAWYLAVDTQMYFLSPLVFFPLVRWPKQTIGALTVLILLNCGYVFEITFKKHLGTTFLNQDATQYRMLYAPTHVRGTAYLVGMICGYFVYQTRAGNMKLKLTTARASVVWIFSVAIMVLIVIAHSLMISAEHYSALDSSFFNAFTRVGWSVVLSIVIILCVNGYGGPINAFLSSEIFTVLIRLNYSVYLLHLNILVMIMAQGRAATYFSNLFGFHRFWGDYIFTLGVSVIWTLAFEAPVITIEKLLFGKRKPKSGDDLKNDVVVVQVTDNVNGRPNNGLTD